MAIITPKLLVLALGTTGGEVGLALKQQMMVRPTDHFHYKICYLDTSDSLRRTGKISESEFIHLTAAGRFMQNAIVDNVNKDPLLYDILYPDVPPPPPTGNGAGNIRYSAAAILTVPAMRERIRSKIATLIDQLAVMGDKRRDISFVILVSAVGATGSGALGLLLPLVLEAAGNAGIASPNCDITVLHPMMNETRQLLLANAQALYAEMAATYNDPINNRYTGRKLIIGSGGQAYTMSNLSDLEQTAATLIRLTTDPLSGITQPYWDSLPNRHVLRDLEQETSLPTHLSSATPITIGLADLGQQVIQIDIARLISRLVLGPVRSDTTQTHVNTLLGLLNSLQGSDSRASYKLLLEQMTTGLRNNLGSSLLSLTGLRRLSPSMQADTLRQQYHSDQENIKQEGPKQIPVLAKNLFEQLTENLHAERAKYITTDESLTQLVNDYKEMQRRINSIQAAAANVKVSPPLSEDQLHRQFDDLARGKKQLLAGLRDAIQQNLESTCEGVAVQTATQFLNALERECVETIRRLEAFIHEARQQYAHEPGWNTEQPSLQAHSDYPLYIPALSTKQAVAQYYERISIFSKDESEQGFFTTAVSTVDPLARFRNELEQQGLLEHFFNGRYDAIFEMVHQHVNKHVLERMERAPLLDVFEQIGGPVLQESMKLALERAQSLISFTRDYATQAVEECYVSAAWSDESQHTMLDKAIRQVSETAKLFRSENPSEIVVFYLIDGLSMPAINDMAGRCLKPFLERRAAWARYNSPSGKQRRSDSATVGIPVYSGRGSEIRVRQQGIIRKLYKARSESVGVYTAADVPELGEPNMESLDEEQMKAPDDHNGLHMHSRKDTKTNE